MAIGSWVSEHKLTSVGALWASGIGASLLANSRIASPMKPSLRLIHARMHAQALTLAVLSGAAAFHCYQNRASVAREAQPPAETRAHIKQIVEWEGLAPF